VATRDDREQAEPLSSILSSKSSTASTSSSECSIDPVFDRTSVTNTVDTLQAGVEQTIDKLFRLSAVIRSAGMSYRYEKAANYVEYENGVNLTQKFREGVEMLFKHKRPSPCRYMVKRLIETLCVRQRELAYSQRSREVQSGRLTDKSFVKSQGVTGIPLRAESIDIRRSGTASATPKFNRTATLNDKRGRQNAAQSTVYTATYLPTDVSIRTRPVASRVPLQEFKTIDDALSNLPPPPKTFQKAQLECPYCAIPHEKAKFEGSAWRYYMIYQFVAFIHSRQLL